MHFKTKKKLNHLRSHIKMNFKKWDKRYPNLVGAFPGEKHVNGRPSGKYSIVFLVSTKQKKPAVMIPPYFNILIPGEGKKKILTDVVKAEKFKLRNANLGDKTKRRNSRQFGAIGAFLAQDGDVFACSNSHVLLADMVRRGESYFFRPINQQQEADVILIDHRGNQFNAFLQEGFFDDIDAAIARVADSSIVGNEIPGLGGPTGALTVQSSDIGLPIQMAGLVSGLRQGEVTRVGITLKSPIGNALFQDLIETSIISRDGDSGSPILNDALRIIGILVGGTLSFSYIIPIDKILNAFKSDLLF